MFTGGEVFSRPDFVEIYKYAFDRNFKILVLSSEWSLIHFSKVTDTPHPEQKLTHFLHFFWILANEHNTVLRSWISPAIDQIEQKKGTKRSAE